MDKQPDKKRFIIAVEPSLNQSAGIVDVQQQIIGFIKGCNIIGDK